MTFNAPALPELPVPMNMERASADLVTAKYRLDELLKGREGAFLSADLQSFRWSAMDPGAFIRACFPFLDACRVPHAEIPARMPMPHVIGMSCKWGPEHAWRGEDDQVAAFLLNDERASPGGQDVAEYFWLQAFGIFWGHEGKNRAQFLRRRGATTMPALVEVRDYPPADEIRRYVVNLNGRREVWAIWQGRWVQRILLPELSEHLLTLYGIPEAERWPASEPDPLMVEAVMGEPNRLQCVDLLPLRASKAHKAETVRMSIINLWQSNWLRVEARYLKWTAAIALASLVLALLPYHPAKLVAGGVWCVLTGFFGALDRKWFLVRRDRLER